MSTDSSNTRTHNLRRRTGTHTYSPPRFSSGARLIVSLRSHHLPTRALGCGGSDLGAYSYATAPSPSVAAGVWAVGVNVTQGSIR
ncbi:hypothetical protein J6590_044228 [Homalodisca vitripennis]|nr:hypothetical protein J6590_044228 [Homalodisca vitripennis]